MVFSSWTLPFCLRRYPPSDAEHHVLVLWGPGVQHGETEISVDDVNQIAEAPLIGDINPPAYIKYLSLTPRVESLQCIHVGDQKGLPSMFLYLRAEQTLSVLGTGVLWC